MSGPPEKPHYHGHRQRLKERLMGDSTALADYEILELLLAYSIPRRDTKPLAKDLLAHFKTLAALFNAPLEDLQDFKGLGPAQQVHFTLLRELKARIAESGLEEKAVLNSPRILADMARARLAGKREEEFWIALVDTRLRLISWEPISKGTVNMTSVYPRDIIHKAVTRKASGVFLVHNHPGGSILPSDNDRNLTEKIILAAQGVDLLVHDHIIVTDDDYFSFKNADLVFPKFIQG